MGNGQQWGMVSSREWSAVGSGQQWEWSAVGSGQQWEWGVVSSGERLSVGVVGSGEWWQLHYRTLKKSFQNEIIPSFWVALGTYIVYVLLK